MQLEFDVFVNQSEPEQTCNTMYYKTEITGPSFVKLFRLSEVYFACPKFISLPIDAEIQKGSKIVLLQKEEK